MTDSKPTAPKLPGAGGSYTRQPDGKLVRNKETPPAKPAAKTVKEA